MIYADYYASLDFENKPATRSINGKEELCIHCGFGASTHFGWNCDYFSPHYMFQTVPVHQRYLTESMRDSLHCITGNFQMDLNFCDPDQWNFELPLKVKEKKYDISDWQSWAHKEPGDCPCGIKKEMCDYHK